MTVKIFWLDIRQQSIMTEKSEKKEKKVSFGWAVKEFILPRKGIVAIGLFLIIVKSVAGLALPFVTQSLLDDVFPNKDFSLLMTLVTILAGALMIQALTSFALTRILSVVAQTLNFSFKSECTEKAHEIANKLF